MLHMGHSGHASQNWDVDIQFHKLLPIVNWPDWFHCCILLLL